MHGLFASDLALLKAIRNMRGQQLVMQAEAREASRRALAIARVWG